SPLRPRSSPSLYSSPILPPLGAPLPTDALLYSSSNFNVNLREPSSHEQSAVLDACLTSGELTRAEEVATRMSAAWGRKRQLFKNGEGPHPGNLSEVLPPRVHADFLRGYLVKALKASQEVTEVLRREKGVWVGKAWAYFDNLSGQVWWDTTTGTNRAIDAEVIAVMFKGLVSLTPYSEGGERKITSLLSALQVTGVRLGDVLRSGSFELEGEEFAGNVTREMVLDALDKAGSGAVYEDWREKVRELREEFEVERERLEAAEVSRNAVELDQTRSVRSPSHPFAFSNAQLTTSPNLRPSQKDHEATASLKNLRENLSALASSSTSSQVSPSDRQRALEASSYDAAQQLYLHEMSELKKVGRDHERGLQSTWLQSVMFEWMRQLQTRLEEDKEGKGKKSAWGKEPDIEPFLHLLQPDKLALITIVELLRLSGAGGVSDGMKSTRAIIHIGRAVETEYRTQVLAKHSGKNKAFEKELDRLSEGLNGSLNQSRGVEILWRRQMAAWEEKGEERMPPEWTQSIRAKVGSILIAALSDVATVKRSVTLPNGEVHTETQPAFSHAYQYVRGQKLGIIRVNPEVAERMETDPLRMTLHPRFLPMVVKPKTWTTYNHGSYLTRDTNVMRTKDSGEQTSHLRRASMAGSLDQIFEGLDVLGSLAWKINRPVFDIISTVWNTGEEFADIPAKNSLSKPVEAEKPDNVETDPRARDTWRQRVKKSIQERRSAHSNRCDVNYKLEIARAFLGERFYFPHNLDFRGRAYPIPPNLSHIGNDLCRGILMFADAKPLGPRGLRWLKIHLANMTGFDKASFDEREAYAMEHLSDVFDSADKPLEGNRWWLKAEDPWQCLATCMELANALRSPVPEEFCSSLPVHQDGTCNGLQHYAALGGDLAGATQVNLDGGDRPADVYSGVAKMANDVIDRDVLEGNEYAKMLQGKVTRKVVKQTVSFFSPAPDLFKDCTDLGSARQVMTTVYGVTFIGAKKQIAKQLKERGDIPIEHLYMCSLYLGRIVLDSIGDVFSGATAIQTWLNRSARLIAKSIPQGRLDAAVQEEKKKKSNRPQPPLDLEEAAKGKKRPFSKKPTRIGKEQMVTVVWTTPLGLPVVQPYRKQKKRQVATTLQTVFIVDPSIPAEVDARAQATAFPPNFIHSLDATHMMMTALKCKDKIAFASVHDSYWTHACDVDEMSTLLREAFIELHSQDILGRLREEFIWQNEGNLVPVSKVPAGIPYGVHDGHSLKIGMNSPLAADIADTEEIYQTLEREDGDVLTPLFQKPSKVRRTIPAWDEDVDADSESSSSAGESEEHWSSQKSSSSANSKFVKLADILPPVPPRGNFDLNKIRDSLYFFS
ncbi:hypothetical protein P7C70_g4683, partial [Phenoliferia sp. Uapishka_3]